MTASPKAISSPLLAWYDSQARALPWRVPPGGAAGAGAAPEPEPADPYRVWLSEIMLQQTTVAAVKPYFAAFTDRWPDVAALAAAPEEAVLAAWAGLGYYSRARNLVKAARVVAERGGFPDSEAELRRLPGVGDYTAAAIAAIAFGRRAVVVDANVERVVARLFAVDTPSPAARARIRAHADAITPDARAGDFAQAMMDLGATICTARSPKCLLCPLARDCAGRLTGDPARFPVKPPKKAKPQRRGRCFWIERAGRVLLVTRPAAGMLGAMRALPDDGWSAQGDGSGKPPFAAEWERRGTVRHGFTHADLRLEVWEWTGGAPGTLPEGEWWAVERLADAGLPTLFRKAAERVLA